MRLPSVEQFQDKTAKLWHCESGQCMATCVATQVLAIIGRCPSGHVGYCGVAFPDLLSDIK